ncbi:MAG: TIR domain-containing protein [Proteobacteria bacterium]|nr:TIR domain-containing protein [Pseudomonadota bacterium]
MAEYYDVFLSHNSHDRPAVLALAKRLKKNGIKVWLDAWELRPGHPWQDAIEEIIYTTRSAVVLVGNDGLGPWEDIEMRACLGEFVHRKMPIIPVLLPDCPQKPQLPLMFRGLTWVDLRDGNEDGFYKLIWGITGNKPKELNESSTGSFSDDIATPVTILLQGDDIYVTSLSLENIRCFGANQSLDLSDGNGRPAQWTVILGENGIGKTTLLQVLANMEVMDQWATNEILSKTFDDFLRAGSIDLRVTICLASGVKLTDTEKQFYKTSISYTITPKGIKTSNYIPKDSTMFYAYGANRRSSKNRLIAISNDTIASLFNDQTELVNAEEFLLQTDYSASKKSIYQSQHKRNLELIIKILINLLPQVNDIRISLPDSMASTPRAEFKTPDGWLRLDELSLGYKTMIAWMVDLVAHMFQRYPDSPNPIAEPAVVLIDEIDLHLHPKWQRTIMSYLSERFVNTQFIVTAHSPLIVQAAENANIAVLKREGDQVVIHQQPQDVKGWRIDQLLTSDLFDLSSARSPHYEALLERRRQILSKAELTEDDQAELKRLEAEIGDLPTAETAEDIEAMDIIRRAAQILKQEA